MDEPSCPYCGLSNPGSRWKGVFRLKGGLDEESFIKGVIYICGAMFVLSILVNPASTRFSMDPFSFLSPDNRSLLLLGATGTIPIDKFHRWWTLVSANFLHGGILHILFNMMAFRQIAPLILQEYGVYRTVSIFTLGGIGGYAASYLAGTSFTLGASGAVCGLIGSALYYGKSRGGYFGRMVYQQLSGWVIGIVIFGLLFPGIDNWAHGGGLAFGALTGLLLGYQERTTENLFHKTVGGVCILVTLLVLAWALISAFYILLYR